MKLRLRYNSIRLRLTRSEVERLARMGALEESIVFAPGAELHYRLRTVLDDTRITAAFDSRTVTVRLPAAAAAEWAASDRVGLEDSQSTTGGSEPLTILIEKDFQCITSEPDPDAFPNPAQSC